MSVLLKVSNCAGSILLFSLCVCTPAAFQNVPISQKDLSVEKVVYTSKKTNGSVISEFPNNVQLCTHSFELNVREGGGVDGKFAAHNRDYLQEKLFKGKLKLQLKTGDNISVEVWKRRTCPRLKCSNWGAHNR